MYDTLIDLVPHCRECPGRHLADSILWIEIASLLATFTLTPARDKEGKEIDVGYARIPPLSVPPVITFLSGYE